MNYAKKMISKSKNMCNESQLYIDYEVIWMVSDIGCLLM